MADYGLAAQIGRGGGAGGMPQQQDPQNRMMQMMQLQQLQQNMMLAREQEARQQQLFGPQLEGKRLENVTEGLRQNVLTNQGRETGAKADVAVRSSTAEGDALDYIATTPPELRADPTRLDALRKTKPAAFQIISDQIARARKAQAEADEAGYSSARKQFEFQRIAREGMSGLLPAITDQNKYSVLYPDFKAVDPVGARLIGPEFTPKNMAALTARLRDTGDLEYKEDAFGQPYVLNKRTGQTEMLTPPQAAGARGPSGVAPAQMGIAPGAFAPSDAATLDAARTAAARAAPIIQPRIAAPEGLGPKAAAKFEETLASETAQAGVKRQGEDVKKQEGQQKTQDTLNDMIESYKRLGGLGELQRKDMSTLERLRIAGQSRLPGDVATALNFDAGSELTTISNLRQSLIPVLTEVMGAKAVDAATESQRIVDSLTTGGQSPAAIAKTLTNFSKKYGTGVVFKPEDLAYTPPAAGANAPRGRQAAPAAAAQPTASAPATGKPTLQEFLAKARPANPNASDADLRAYYDRTYGGR